MTSHGYAAPTFGRSKLNLIASHNRPNVGATREVARTALSKLKVLTAKVT